MTARNVTAAAAVLVAALLAAGASAAPSSFHLVFDGRHNAAFLHEGTFTTSASFCAAGVAADVSLDAATESSLRTFTCSGSGGDFTARVMPLPAEHGGAGTWQIVAGSGLLANLRGQGTWTSTRLSGRPDDPATITFRSTWEGVADFDVSPPTIAVPSSSARKLKHPIGAYSLRVVIALSDAGGGPFSYLLQVVDPRKPSNALVYKPGQTTTGAVSSTSRIRPAKRTRVLQLKITASDAVGNQAAFTKTLRLR